MHYEIFYICVLHHILLGRHGRAFAYLHSFPKLLEHPNSLTLLSSPWIIQESAAYQEYRVRHAER